MPPYEIRQYHPDDKNAFLSLYRTVMGREQGTKWFAWKYEQNPYTDHVPMIVGVDGGEIVAARPFFALPISHNGRCETVLQPADAMVHPDHRRQGLFTRMTERAIEQYTGAYRFFFNFPNARSLSGNLTLGWRVVSKRPCYYRIAHPERVAAAQTDHRAIHLLGKLATPIATGYHRLRDYTASETATTTVRTEPNLLLTELTALYATAVSDEIHACRDEQFYRWRLANPNWIYRTYLAENASGPIAAIVTGTSVGPRPTTTKLTDVVPVKNAPEPALVALIGQILTDHAETDIFVAPSQGFPRAVLTAFGFHADNRFPLSALACQTTHVVRGLSDDGEHSAGELTDPARWALTFIEEDTS